MKRSILPTVLISALLLSACGSIPSPNQPPTPPVQNPADPVPTRPMKPVDSAPEPAPAPAPKPPSSGGDPAPDPVPVEPTPVTWMPRGIGLPLAPSHPAAAEQRVVLLTFDDGPSEWTPAILDALAKEKVQAVFFITGYSARQHPELLERIHRDGHLLGVHTMTHPNMSQLSRAEQRKEIEPLVELIEQVTGEKPRYFRPPFGAYNQDLIDLLQEMELELINWTNGSLDWEGVVNGYKDPNQVVDDVMSQLHRGAVILFHDTMRHTAEAIPEVIRQIRAEGYEFVNLPWPT